MIQMPSPKSCVRRYLDWEGGIKGGMKVVSIRCLDGSRRVKSGERRVKSEEQRAKRSEG